METSVVDPADDDALVDELPVPALVVAETASWAGAGPAQAASTITVSNEIGNRLIVPAARFEPRLEQETSNRIVIVVRLNFQSACSGSSLLFLTRSTSSGELDIMSSTISILDPGPALPGTSILPR